MPIKERGKYNPINFFKLTQNTIRKRLPKDSSKAFYDLLIKNILSNKYGFRLSRDWSNTKSSKGWDNRPFIAEGYYIKNIEIFSKEGHLTIGFKKRKKHPRTKYPLGEIAKVLEYGIADKNIPARPLWRNTIEEFMQKYSQFVTKKLDDSFK